jgi:hypothetical protein
MSSACREASPPVVAERTPIRLRWGVATASDQAVSSFASQFALDPLIGIAWDGRPVDRIVYEPQWTDQELGLKLRLQKDVLFHDGTPLDIGSFREILEKVLKTPQPPGTKVSQKSSKSR